MAYDDQRLEPALAYLANGAEQPVAPERTLAYAVTGAGPYQLSADGDPVASLDSPEDVLFVLYRNCHTRLLDHLAGQGYVPVHGAIVDTGQRRTMVVGPKGAGKTTLMLRLLFDGQRVEGDELVFIRDGSAVCLPRNFHVKSGTRVLVPEIVERWPALPKVATTDGTAIAAFNPAAAGLPWSVGSGPVDAAVILRPDHGATAALRPLGNVALVEAAVANCFGAAVERRAVVRECSRLLGSVDGFELTVGDVGAAADLLVAAARRTA